MSSFRKAKSIDWTGRVVIIIAFVGCDVVVDEEDIKLERVCKPS